MVERGTGPRSLMEGSKGCQEPDSSLTMCDVRCSSRVGRLRLEGSWSELGGPMVGSIDVDLVSLGLKKSISPGWRERIPFYR